MNYIHEKFHRYSHHTTPTPGIPDSATDPLASPSFPFHGDFVITGQLSAAGGIAGGTSSLDIASLAETRAGVITTKGVPPGYLPIIFSINDSIRTNDGLTGRGSAVIDIQTIKGSGNIVSGNNEPQLDKIVL